MVTPRRALLVWLLLGAPLPAAAESAEAPTEYGVKAAFLYNFAKFIQWPSAPRADEGPFVITILGRDPFGTALEDTLRGKKIDNQRILLRRVSRAEEVGSSRILFISDSERDRLPRILDLIGTNAVLTVGEMSRFAERGGVIRFKVDQDRIRLEINLAAARRSGLRISSQLLKVAQIVDPGTGG
jgi:hypothetical protein